jgi:hypothetical protein
MAARIERKINEFAEPLTDRNGVVAPAGMQPAQLDQAVDRQRGQLDPKAHSALVSARPPLPRALRPGRVRIVAPPTDFSGPRRHGPPSTAWSSAC